MSIIKFTIWYLVINWRFLFATSSMFGRYTQLRKMTIFGHWRLVAWKEEAFKLLSFNECVCCVTILQANRECRHKCKKNKLLCSNTVKTDQLSLLCEIFATYNSGFTTWIKERLKETVAKLITSGYSKPLQDYSCWIFLFSTKLKVTFSKKWK